MYFKQFNSTNCILRNFTKKCNCNYVIKYIFKGLAFETLGPWYKGAIDFVNVIGNRLIAESGDSESKKFLFETISLAIQRGNAASIRGTFPDSALLSEIFVL
jgi:predicted N-acyltransferase